MLLPFETNGCIDSMEGLLFESSATTPYHFLNQAELSAGPSEPEVGLPYGPLDVTLGVQHLQLLGVKYFMAETPQVEQEAAADPDLQLVAKSGPWTYDYSGADTHHDMADLPGEGLAPRHTAGQRPGGPLGGETRAVELARHRRPRGTFPVLVHRPEQVERRAGPERSVGLAPDPGERRPSDRQARGDDQGLRRHADRFVHQLPRLPGGDAGPGQGVLLSQLAGHGGRRPVARHAEPHGGRPHQPRRDPDLRRVGGQPPRAAGHAARAGGSRDAVRGAHGPRVEAPAEAPEPGRADLRPPPTTAAVSRPGTATGAAARPVARHKVQKVFNMFS